MTDLRLKMEKVRKSFDVEALIERELDEDEVDSYYRYNRLLYKVMLSWKGYMHMGITRGESFSKSDLEEIPKIISDYIEEFSEPDVLELGCGTGANLEFLSSENKDAQFRGLDHSEKNVSKARKKFKDRENCSVDKGDFHDLSRYGEDSFDLIFVVEALCYSNDKEEVLSEVRRVLKSEGIFLVFDGYMLEDRETLSEDRFEAQRLLERSFMLDEFTRYDDFLEKAKNKGFVVENEENFSKEIMPTATRFPTLTNLFFNHSKLNYPLRKILPEPVRLKAISAYLMKDLVKEKIDGYYFTALNHENDEN